jgi:hypothetical protein
MRATAMDLSPNRSGAGLYKTQKEAQVELELYADEGLPILYGWRSTRYPV